MKLVIILFLLFVACGLAMLLVMRLNAIMAQLSQLRGDMKRNDDRLETQVHALNAAAPRDTMDESSNEQAHEHLREN